MRTRLLLSVILLGFSVNVFGQNIDSVIKRLEQKYSLVCYHDRDGGWISVYNNRKEGACNLKGEEVIPCEYDNVVFRGYYYEVKNNGKVAIRDLNGRELLGFFYDDVRWYQIKDEGYCEVKLNGKIGIVDKNGKELVPTLYDEIRWYQIKDYGCCEVKLDGKWGVVDKNGREFIRPYYDDISLLHLKKDGYIDIKSNGKHGIVDKNDKELVPILYDEICWYQIKDYGCCEVKLDGKWGVVDKNGRELIPPHYEKVQFFQLKDKDYCDVKLDGKWGVVDRNCKEVIPPRYDYVGSYVIKDKGFAFLKENDKHGIWNIEFGKEVVPCVYDSISTASTKDYYIVKSNSKWGVINSQGRTVVPINYEYIGLVIDCDYCQVVKDIKYQDSYWTKTYQNIPAKVIKNGKWGVYDMKNNKQIVSCNYEYIGFPSEGLIIFNVNGDVTGLMPGKVIGGKWGYMDTSGNIVIKPEYDAVYVFKDGVAQVTKNNVTSIISNPLTGTSLQIANGYSHSSSVDVNIPENGNVNPELFAFIFANENYADFSGADYAIRDGKTMKEYCRKTLGVPDNNIRYYEDATFGNISSALKKIQDIAEVYDGDAKIIFYFTGLGMTDEKTKERYLLPSDASKASIAATGIRVSTLINTFNEFNTEYSLILLDAPFSGTDRKGNMLASSRGIRISAKNDTEPKGTTVVCTSGSNDDISYCDEQAGHGLFTYVLLSGLQETKGNCTIKELLEKTSHQTRQSSLQNFNTVQSPEIKVSQEIENRWQSLKF